VQHTTYTKLARSIKDGSHKIYVLSKQKLYFMATSRLEITQSIPTPKWTTILKLVCVRRSNTIRLYH